MQPGIQPRCFWKSSRGSCPSTTPSPCLHNCLNLVSILCSPGALHSAAALLKQRRWGKGRGIQTRDSVSTKQLQVTARKDTSKVKMKRPGCSRKDRIAPFLRNISSS